jgi:hypothetical protein
MSETEKHAYRVFFLDSADKVIGRIDLPRTILDDAPAIEAAEAVRDGKYCELWDCARMVHRFLPDERRREVG